MAVFMVNRYFYPDHAATAQMLSDLAFHAAARGLTVTVVTGRQRLEDARARLPARERLHGLEVRRLWSTRFGRAGLVGRALDYLSFHVSALGFLLGALRAGDTVVAATDPPLLGVTASWAARVRGARLVHWLHDVFPEAAAALGVRGAGGLPGRLLRRLRNASLRQAAVSVVLGERMAARVRALGAPEGAVRVIHNWSDGTDVKALPHDANPWRRAMELDGRVVIGYSGNLGRAHDLSMLPGVARALSDLPDVLFLVVGSGAGLVPLRDAVQAMGLDNVRFAPYQPRERLGQVLAAADIHLASLRPALEGYMVPSKVYGILAAGRPCVNIGDREGEVARILAWAGSGFTVSPDDPAALESVLRRLHADAPLRERMGRAARKALEQRFDRSRAMQSWMALLTRVSGEGHGRDA